MKKTLSVVLKGEQSSPVREQLFKLFNTSGLQRKLSEDVIADYCYKTKFLHTDIRNGMGFRIVEVNSMVDMRKGYPDSIMEIVIEIEETEDAS